MELTYRWHIEGFSGKRNAVLESPSIVGEVENKSRTEWRLLLFTHGTTIRPGLKLLKSSAEVEVHFKIGINDHLNGSDEHIILQGKCLPVSGIRQRLGNPEELHPDSPYLKGDTLVIRCQIYINSTPETTVPESKSFRKFWKFVEDKKYTDATVRVGGKEFDVHKMVLAASSSVFAAMFDHGLTEANQNSVEISDFSSDTVEEFLRFIYKGEFNYDGNLMDLLACADKYDVDALKMKCEQALGEKLSIDNAAEVLFRADLHGVSDLKDKAINFIKYNIREIYNTDAWQSLSKELTSQVIFSMADMIKEMKAPQNHRP